MAQKRKMEVTVVDENDNGLHSIFQNTANDLSQLYSLAINQQKLAFYAGQKHALEKLNEWIALKLQEGKFVTVPEISTYLQNELNSSLPSSHQSGTSPNRQMELGLSSSATSQEKDGNALGSKDLEMEITS